MKQIYYWERIKKDVGKFMSKCMNCQLAKDEQKKPSGLSQPLEISLEWIILIVYQGLGQVMMVFE